MTRVETSIRPVRGGFRASAHRRWRPSKFSVASGGRTASCCSVRQADEHVLALGNYFRSSSLVPSPLRELAIITAMREKGLSLRLVRPGGPRPPLWSE